MIYGDIRIYMGLNIAIVGGAGAIGLVHAWMLAASGHKVTIVDSRPDGQMGKSFENLTKAKTLDFEFLEIKQLVENLPEEGEATLHFEARFENFPLVVKSRIKEGILNLQKSALSKIECIDLIENALRLPSNRVNLAQASTDIDQLQDIIIVTVKCAALNSELGYKIQKIPQRNDTPRDNTPIVVFTNGMQPWIKPESNFGDLYLSSLRFVYEFISCIGIEKVKAGVLIKYGAAIEDHGKFCVRSPFLDTRNIIANITNTDITDDLQMVSRVYTQAGIKTEPTAMIPRIILDKLNYNLTGSIMGAIFNYTMGELVNNEQTKYAVEICAKELYQLALKLNVKLSDTETEFVKKTIDALEKNSSVISSPLQDIRAGRGTEKEFLLKATIELGQQYQMNMPVLQAMYDLISMIEKKACKKVTDGKILQEQLLSQLKSQNDIVMLANQRLANQLTLKFFSHGPLKNNVGEMQKDTYTV